MKGCDYAWDRPDLDALWRSGIRFVIRYLSYDTTGKNLDQAEARRITDAGMSIVANWEYNKLAARLGFQQGVRDATAAQSQLAIIGAPFDAPVYFSVDYDVPVSDLAAVGEYFRGCASVLGAGRVGAYGGLRVITYLAQSPEVWWLWQTYAWSGGQWSPSANLRQVQNGVTIGGGIVDIDESMTVQFGQWTLGGNSMALRDDPDFFALIERVKSLVDMSPTTEAGPTVPETLALVAHLGKLDTVLSQVAGNGNTLSSVTSTLNSIMSRLDAIEAKTGAAAGTLHVTGDLTIGQ